MFIFSDLFLLLETLAIILVLVIYSWQQKNYLTAAWVLPQRCGPTMIAWWLSGMTCERRTRN